MIVLRIILLVILALLLILLFTPFGVAVRYEGGEFTAAARVLCFDIPVFPRKEKEGKGEKKPKKEKKPKPEKEPQEEQKEQEGEKPKRKLPIGIEDIPKLFHLLMDTLSRFRRKLTVNYFMLHLVVAGNDPYNTAMMYGAVCALLGILQAKQGKAFRVLRSDVQTAVDFTQEELMADAALTITISLGRILAVVIAMGWGFLKIIREKKKRDRAKAAEERKDTDGTDPDGGIPAGQHG